MDRTVVTLAAPATGWPLLLADAHRESAVGAAFEFRAVPNVDGLERLHDLVTGGGFEITRSTAGTTRALRARTLPDYVAPGLRVLFVGLNPSEYAADAGVGFARPGNRFWPAVVEAGIVSRARDPRHALVNDHVGMTDLVKRATPSAAGLSAGEYRAGVERVERLVAWLSPGVVCVVGLSGWRAAIDRRTTAGWQPSRFGGRPVYVMPNTSGLNAHATPAVFAEHLRAVSTRAERRSR